MITFNDLLERLKQEDEVSFLEILDFSTGDLVDLLWSEIFDRQQRVWDYYEQEDAEDLDG